MILECIHTSKVVHMHGGNEVERSLSHVGFQI